MDSDHWNNHARLWKHLGPPLRPAEEDISILRASLGLGTAPRQVLLLGVTPEIVALGWGAAVRLLAVDRTFAMLNLVLPRPSGLDLTAICADWRCLPLARHSIDQVVGDNPVSAFEPFGHLKHWVEEMHRVLRPGGSLVLRHFLRPVCPTPVKELFADLSAGRLPSFHVFKLCLTYALHGDFDQGVRPAAIWEVWQRHGIDPAALARDTGWPEEQIRTIEAYRGSGAVYLFPTAEELSALMADRFREISRQLPSYALGELFPTVVYHAR